MFHSIIYDVKWADVLHILILICRWWAGDVSALQSVLPTFGNITHQINRTSAMRGVVILCFQCRPVSSLNGRHPVIVDDRDFRNMLDVGSSRTRSRENIGIFPKRPCLFSSTTTGRWTPTASRLPQICRASVAWVRPKNHDIHRWNDIEEEELKGEKMLREGHIHGAVIGWSVHFLETAGFC